MTQRVMTTAFRTPLLDAAEEGGKWRITDSNGDFFSYDTAELQELLVLAETIISELGYRSEP